MKSYRLYLIFLLFCILPFSLQSRIYDCFTFFNEWEIVEIRLNELYPYVDKFVIVEAAQSFRGLPKPYRFLERASLFEKFADKILYVQLDTLPGHTEWERANYQKNYALFALQERGIHCEPDDVVLFSDVDEIPPGYLLPPLPEALKKNPIIGFEQTMYRHFLNRLTYNPNWVGTVAIRYGYIYCYDPHRPSVSLNDVRSRIAFDYQRKVPDYKQGQIPIPVWDYKGDWVDVPIWKGGWHFTSMGGFSKFCDKVENWEHWQNPHPTEIVSWRKEVDWHILVPIDESFPRFVQENIPYLIEIGMIDQN